MTLFHESQLPPRPGTPSPPQCWSAWLPPKSMGRQRRMAVLRPWRGTPGHITATYIIYVIYIYNIIYTYIICIYIYRIYYNSKIYCIILYMMILCLQGRPAVGLDWKMDVGYVGWRIRLENQKKAERFWSNTSGKVTLEIHKNTPWDCKQST